MSPTAITAEAKVTEHEFCLILLVWHSRIDLLSELALGIQCCRQDGDCAQTGSQGRVDCVATTTTIQENGYGAILKELVQMAWILEKKNLFAPESVPSQIFGVRDGNAAAYFVKASTSTMSSL